MWIYSYNSQLRIQKRNLKENILKTQKYMRNNSYNSQLRIQQG